MKYFIGFTVFLFLSGCVVSQIVEQKPVRLSSKQIQSIQAAASYNLIDPESANFRNVRARDIRREDGTEAVEFCGEVNAKNRMGGYAGFSPFKGKFVGSEAKIEFMDNTFDTLGTASLLCSAF